jgi:hypothetical protein
LQVLSKKIVLIIFLVLLLFAGIIALTQEADDELPDIDLEETEFSYDFEFDMDIDGWIKPARWFRSNSGGMALEEVQSRFAALRNQYALAINYVSMEEVPEYLFSYYDENYFVEVRILYKKGEQIRAQWIFRDEKGATRLNAVFLEPEFESEAEEENIIEEEKTAELIAENENEVIVQTTDTESAQITGEQAQVLAQTADEELEEAEIDIVKDIKNRKGFIEIFNEDLFLISEYRFYEDGKITKTEYQLKDGLLISASYSASDIYGDDYTMSHIDYYRYNRSFSLRSIERIFHKDEASDDPVIVTFPRRIMDMGKMGVSLSERLNLYPEFFGDIFIYIGSKMIYDIDDRGTILGQTLYDDDGNIIWVIKNTWQNNRIAVTTKTEGEKVLSAEYAYNSNGDRILERNIRNGVLERVVSAEGDTEIEELYMNNVVVVRAIWENGRKISETMVRN